MSKKEQKSCVLFGKKYTIRADWKDHGSLIEFLNTGTGEWYCEGDIVNTHLGDQVQNLLTDWMRSECESCIETASSLIE